MRTLIKRTAIAAFNYGLLSTDTTAAIFRIFALRDH
jgi:hypothetical protein